MIVDWVGVIMIIASLIFATKDCQQVVKRGVHPPEVANVTPVDGVRVGAKVIVGQLLQPRQLGVEGGSAGDVGVEGGLLGVLGVYRRLRG